MQYVRANLASLIRVAEERPLVCFGAGEELRRFIEYCCECQTSIPVVAIVDNSPAKQDGIVDWNGRRIAICALDQICDRMEITDWLVTVSARNLVAILEQLERMPNAKEFRIYWAYSFLPSNIVPLKHEFPFPLRLTFTPRIPKIIHYAWFGNQSIPEEHQEYIAGWKELCPDYQFVCWNEENYDVKKNKYMYQAYKAQKWGFVPDYLRKDVVYQYGGVYLDTDVEMIRPIDDLLYQDGFCGFEGNRVAFGLGFGAVRGLDIMREMCETYDSMSFEFKPRAEMLIGPDYETRQLVRHGLQLNGEYQLVAGLTVYPTDVLSGTIPYTGEKAITSMTYTVHHYAGSWDDSVDRKSRNVTECLVKDMLTKESFEIQICDSRVKRDTRDK